MHTPRLAVTASCLFKLNSTVLIRLLLVCCLVMALAPMLSAVTPAPGSVPTSTNLTATKSGYTYDLAATVSGEGTPAPDGKVEFYNVTDGNALLGTANLIPLAGTYTTMSGTMSHHSETLVAGDFNEDGFTDIASFDFDNNVKNVTILRGTATGEFQTISTFAIPVEQGTSGNYFPGYAAIAADLNNDGHLDLAMTAYGSTSVVVFLGHGDGTFNAGNPYRITDTQRWASYPIALTAADFNGDGILDIAVATGYGYLYIMDGVGDGSFPTTRFHNIEGGNWPTAIIAADFNNDSKIDIAELNSYNDNMNVILGNGDGTFQFPLLTSFAGTPSSVGAADFDGDGFIDLAVGVDSNKLYILRGSGDGHFTTAILSGVGERPLLQIDDITLDGKPDIVVTTDTPVDVYGRAKCVRVFVNDGSGNLNVEPCIEFPWQNTLTRPVVGRFTDRGTRDIAVAQWQEAASTLHLILRTGAKTSAAHLSGVTLPSGNNDVVAKYVPGDNSIYLPSTSNALTLDGGSPQITTTTLTSSKNPSTYGETVSFTAQVTAGKGTPSGAIRFIVDGELKIDGGTLDENGRATLSETQIPVGSYALVAEFIGNEMYLGSSSPAIMQVVNKADTSATLSATPSTVGPGQEFVITVYVISANAKPVGEVHLLTSGGAVSAWLTSDGTASFPMTLSTEGSHVFSAVYLGEHNFNGSTSGTITVDVGAKASTTTALTSSENPLTYGSSTTLTATVTSAKGTPTGAVEFFNGATLLKSVALNASGIATVSVTNFSGGTHNITAAYAGDGNFLASTSTALVQTVTKANTATVIASSKKVVHLPGSVVLSATVTSAAGTPAGTVTFMLGTTSVGTATLDNAGKATLTVQEAAAPGKTTVSAVYAGDGNFAGSTSAGLTQYVFANAPSYRLVGDPMNLTLRRGQSGKVTVTLTPSNGFDGTVSFNCTGMVQGMSCVFSPAQLTGNLDGTSVTTTLTVLTLGPSTSATNSPSRRAPKAIFAMWTVGLFGIVSVAGGLSGRRRRVLMVLMATAALVALLLSMGACGGSDSFSTWTPVGTGNAVVTANASAASDGATTSMANQQLQITVTVVK